MAPRINRRAHRKPLECRKPERTVLKTTLTIVAWTGGFVNMQLEFFACLGEKPAVWQRKKRTTLRRTRKDRSPAKRAALLRGIAAVNDELGACYEASFIRGQEQYAVGYVIGLAKVTQGIALDIIVQIVRIISQQAFD